MALPLSSHPIFNLRKATIIIAIIGIFFCCISSSSYYYDGGSLAASVVLLVLSALLCTTDLISYATKKVEHPEEEPEWPLRRWMIVDIIMALVLQFIFWCSIVDLTNSYGYGTNIVGAYGALAGLLCSLVHGVSFWRETMAIYKKHWLSRLAKQPCARCGYIETNGETSTHILRPEPNNFTYAGPSAEFARANDLTPETSASTMEQGLLIGSDYGSGYGSSDRPEPTLEQPEEVVVGKGKRKGRKPCNGTVGNIAGKEVVS